MSALASTAAAPAAPVGTATRYAGLRYRKTPGGWRVVDVHDAGRAADVGPIYRTRAELLGDLDRYASETWGY